jgi:hypothetical protein
MPLMSRWIGSRWVPSSLAICFRMTKALRWSQESNCGSSSHLTNNAKLRISPLLRMMAWLLQPARQRLPSLWSPQARLGAGLYPPLCKSNKTSPEKEGCHPNLDPDALDGNLPNLRLLDPEARVKAEVPALRVICP